MSGGSYNYLCHQDRIDIYELERMADRLAELAPGSRADRDTRALWERLQGDETSNALRDVWHAVEWFDSCDYGEDQARAAIADYEQGERSS